jgi:hypothetical protein
MHVHNVHKYQVSLESEGRPSQQACSLLVARDLTVSLDMPLAHFSSLDGHGWLEMS